MVRRQRSGAVTFAEMDSKLSEYGGRAGRDVEVSGDAASQRSAMVRSDPNDSGSGVKK